MLRRAWKYIIGVPLGVVLLTLAVINRHPVRLVLDPFRPEDPVVSMVLPFYAYLIGAALVGVVIGGSATWLAQARWRRSARRGGAEARRWQAEADRLARERQAAAGADRQLVTANR